MRSLEFDRFYDMALSLLNQLYPEKSVTITSADPDLVSPAVKSMLCKKNKLMRLGRIEEADALARRIGRPTAIIRYNSAELSRVDPVANSRAMWDKVRQLTGRTHTRSPQINCSSSITAQSLNEHYALMLTINLPIVNLLPTRAPQTSLGWKYLTCWTN